MRRLTIALASLLVLLFAFTGSAGAQNLNCDNFDFQEEAQAVFDQDTNDPNGLDGPIGPDNDTSGTPGLACEDLPSNGGGGGGADDGDDTGSDDGDDTGSDDGGETAELPSTGVGTTANGTDSMLLVTALSGIAALLGFTALRARNQA